jgi:hypothetical protein
MNADRRGSNLRASAFIFGTVLLLLSIVFYTASQQPSPAVARKVLSYNDQIRSGEAEQWHLEDFRKELEAEPQSKAYVIAYSGREDTPGKALRYAVRAMNYLVEYRGIAAQRIITVDGGRREEFIVELWLVPRNAKPPEPTPTITVPDDPGDNLLYDEFGIGYENFSSQTEDDRAHLDGFAIALKKELNSWGCIVAYAMSGDDRTGGRWDSPGEALKIARRQRSYLVKKHQLPMSRLSVIDGGYADRTVELWIMRPNARFDSGPFVYQHRLIANKKGTLKIGRDDVKESCCRACAQKNPSRR